MIEAGLGRERECRAHVTQALELSERFGTDSLMTYAHAALAFLELGRGHPQQAIGHLERVVALVAEHGVVEPGVVEWAPEMVAAYAQAGRTNEAEKVLADFEVLAERTERVSALAAAARCRGLMESSGSFEKHFEAAFQLLQRIERPFERARTELELGRRLRRERRAVDAREPLRHALGSFESLGARPWAEKAPNTWSLVP